MRKSRPRYPKPKDVIPVKIALETLVPMDTPFQMGWRESKKLVPNFRLKSITNEIEWSVDIYSGGYYVINVGTRLSETCKSIPSLIHHVCRGLGVKPKKGAEDV